jgi:hypothetical protein
VDKKGIEFLISSFEIIANKISKKKVKSNETSFLVSSSYFRIFHKNITVEKIGKIKFIFH